MDMKKLLLAATRYERTVEAQAANPLQGEQSSQAGDIQGALERAHLWDLTAVVSPLLEQAGVPDNASVNIGIVVTPGPIPTVSYSVMLAPPDPKRSRILSGLIGKQLSMKMAQALAKDNKLNLTSPVSVDWLKF